MLLISIFDIHMRPASNGRSTAAQMECSSSSEWALRNFKKPSYFECVWFRIKYPSNSLLLETREPSRTELRKTEDTSSNSHNYEVNLKSWHKSGPEPKARYGGLCRSFPAINFEWHQMPPRHATSPPVHQLAKSPSTSTIWNLGEPNRSTPPTIGSQLQVNGNFDAAHKATKFPYPRQRVSLSLLGSTAQWLCVPLLRTTSLDTFVLQGFEIQRDLLWLIYIQLGWNS